MAYSRISFPCFLFILVACIHFVTIFAQHQQLDVHLEYYEDTEQYVPPKQSVYETIYKKDQEDHQKKSVYERLYKPQKTTENPPQQGSNGIEFFPRSTDHPLDETNVRAKHFSTYIPMIFVFFIIVFIVLVTLHNKFPKASWSTKTTSSNAKLSPTPSPTKNSFEKKKRKTMLRRLQEIPKQQAQEIIQNDVRALIRTDSGSNKDFAENKEAPNLESNDNANDSETEIMEEAKEAAKAKYSTVATMDRKPKRKNIPLFQDDKKKSNRESKPKDSLEKLEEEIIKDKNSLTTSPPNSNPPSPLKSNPSSPPSSNPCSPAKGTAGLPGTEHPDSVEPEDSKKNFPTPEQPINNNKGSLPENTPPPSPHGERDMMFLYNIISSIKTEQLKEEQKIAFAQLLLQKYAIEYEFEKRQSKQQEFLIKEQNKQKRHEDEIQLHLAEKDEVFQHNLFLVATIVLLGTWFFFLTRHYHGLLALILNYWWDFGIYCIDSLGISITENSHNYWTWVNPFTVFEDMVLRTVTLLFALVASIFLAILTLRSPRLGGCITVYMGLHICWESLLRVLVASAPLYLVIYGCCSLLTTRYPKISNSRNMYQGAVFMSTIMMSAVLGHHLVACDPLNPEGVPGSLLCAFLDFVL